MGALYSIAGIVFEQDMGKRKWPNPISVLLGGWWDRPSHHVTDGSPPTLSDPENVFFVTPPELRSITERGCFQLLAVFSMYISFLQEKRLFT